MMGFLLPADPAVKELQSLTFDFLKKFEIEYDERYLFEWLE